jgi:pimeloyl-ACP methyl ester carboxylesterase
MEKMELSAGTIEYEDTGGDGPVVVLLHGLLMDASLWEGVMLISASTIGAWHRRCRWAPTPIRCGPTPTIRCAGLRGSSRNFSSASIWATSPWSAMTPAAPSSSCSSAKAPHASRGSCSSPATRSTTSRPA